MKSEFKNIKVKKEVWDFLMDDRDHFEKVIGGGNWSINDTITEYKKILDGLKK